MKSANRSLIAVLVAGVSIVLTCSGRADAAILTYNNAVSAATRGDGPFTVGSLIQVGATSQLVTALGVQDGASSGGVGGTDGFASSPIQVGIWDASDNSVVATTTVSSTDPLGAGNYRYSTLTTPVTLVATKQYLIGAFVGSGKEFFVDGDFNAPYSADTGFTLLGARFRSGSFGSPTSVGDTGGRPVGRWGAANALTTPTPEPGSIGLLGAVAGLGVMRRRRRRPPGA